MNKDLVLILMLPILIMVSIPRGNILQSQWGIKKTYNISIYNPLLNLILEGERNKTALNEIPGDTQNYPFTALELMYKKEFKTFDH